MAPRFPGSSVAGGRDSAKRFQSLVAQAVSRFGSAVSPLLRPGVGQDEANLTAPVEVLLREVAQGLGLRVLIHREASDRALSIRPDLAVDVEGARAGVIELKAPGFGVPGSKKWGKTRDRIQWEKLKALRAGDLDRTNQSWICAAVGQETRLRASRCRPS